MEEKVMTSTKELAGDGGESDDFKAVKFYQKACDLNDGNGCSNLGFMYEVTPLPSSYISPRLEQPLPSFKSHAFWKNLSALKSSCLTPKGV
jgi:TPR repeat protein